MVYLQRGLFFKLYDSITVDQAASQENTDSDVSGQDPVI